MSKAKRLMGLWMAVNRKRTFTVKELAREFEVSPRTILRDLQELGEIGVPLYSEPGPHGGYRVLDVRVLPPIAFTEDEAIAMFVAAHALRHYKSLPFEAEMASALQKFTANLPSDVRDRIDEMKNRVDIVVPRRYKASPHLGRLLQAAVRQEVLMIRYDSKESTYEAKTDTTTGKADTETNTVTGAKKRAIQPIGIFAHNGLWYCPAYCFEHEDIRLFRCDRMLSVEAGNGNAMPRDLGHLHLGNRRSFGKEKQATVHLDIELDREGVHAFEAELWASSLLHVREDGTGAIRGVFPESDLPFLARFLLGIGQGATVHHPPRLIVLLKQQAKAILQKYG